MVIRKENIRFSFYILIVIFIWMIFAFNTDNADYIIYKNWYDITSVSGLTHRFEIGYSLLMVLGTKLGLSYQEFLMFFSAIGLFLIAYSIYDYCDSPCVAIILYFVYPFFFDVVQIRNFMAEAIIFFSIRFLKNYSIKNILAYISLCLLSMSFHTASIFYLLFILAYLKDYQKIVKIVILFIIGWMICYALLPNQIINWTIKFVSEDYIEMGSTLSKVLGYGFFAIVAVVLSYYSEVSCKNKLYKDNEDGYLNKLIPIILITCIFISISSQGYRYFRNMSLIVYVVFLNNGLIFKGAKIQGTKIRFLNTVFAVSYAIFFFMRQLSWNAALYETVTKKIIESNFLFH